MEADVLEDIAQVAQFLAAGRRRLRIEVEDLAVLYAVIGEPADTPFFVEINARSTRWSTTSCGMKATERLGLLRDVIEGFTVDALRRSKACRAQ